ncbi:phosphatase PAP2 family protein [Paenibacillus chartarius]|uniref:Phosphatase PAP2 family protein n=1 Tax=Paenibacillus chartarius TaxID=747481 RepID=A0ABV6DIX8_9BACL
MTLFQSMTQATIYMAVTVFFLLFVSLRTNPLAPIGSFIQEMIRSRKYRLHFVMMCSVMFINKIELWIEEHMPSRSDFTPFVSRLEGDFVAKLQHTLEQPWLTALSAYAYVVVFPVLIFAAIGIYTYGKQVKLVYAICYALLLNYMIAIPFYLFFPVNEVWSFHPQVRFLMLDVFPTFETQYRSMSGLDNCFPSLHTSISVAMALIALRSNNRFWKWFCCAAAAFIIFTIFYLGIHWLFDMCGGLLLGGFTAAMALLWSEGRTAFGVSWMPQRVRERFTK